MNMLEQKLFALADQVGFRVSNIHEQVKVLRKKEILIQAFKRDKYRIKSLIQTYDIRDAEKYQGVLELERLLQKKNEMSTDRLTDKMR